MRARTILTVGTVAITLVLGAGYALAEAASQPVTPTYTGCLAIEGSNKGKFFAVATGSTPTRTCSSTEKQVRLSGGDLTSIGAGTGLRVTSTELGLPDANGDASLDLAPGYRLPQTCSEGQYPARSATSWTCTAPLGRARVGYTGGTDLPLGEDWTVVGDGMTLAPGSYTLTAKVVLSEDYDSDESGVAAECRLDATGNQFLDVAHAVVRDTPDVQTLPLAAAVTKAETFRVAVVCHDFAGSEVEASHLRIVATPIHGYDKENLGD